MSKPTDYDAIVLGVGAMGASTCWRLAKRGARVLGIERGAVPNAIGSSHGYTRMTRSAYCEHPDYVPLVRSANTLWRELEAQTDERVLFLEGALYMGAPDSPLIAGSKRAADEHSVPYEILGGDELSSRFPQFALPGAYVGLLEREAGYLRPELAVSLLAVRALAQGAEIHGCETALDWHEDKGGISVRTDQGEYRAAQLIVAAGAWSSKMLAGLRIPLDVTRQALVWVWPRRPERFQPGVVPVWAVGHEDASMHYGFPMLKDNPGLKIALHAPGPPADPDTLDRRPQPSDEATVRQFLRDVVPDADGPLLSIRICMYVNSPDHHFIIDRLPSSDRVTIACGFSGHGFKFAPVIGDALADLALNGGTSHPIGFLGLSRFDCAATRRRGS